jgi:hypothetical protein
MNERNNPFLDHKDDNNQSSDDWDELINNPPSTDADIARPDRILKKKRVTLIAIIIIGLLALSAGGYFGSQAMLNSRIKNDTSGTTSTTAPTPTSVPSKTSTKQSGLTNPASSVTGLMDSPSGDINVKADGNTITFENPDKSSSAIQLKTVSKITATTSACTLKDANTTCFLGSGQVDKNAVDIYAFRNAKTSSFLYSKNDAKQVNSNGASSAFMQSITYNAKSQSALYIVLSNQNGIMITSNDSATVENIANDTANHFTITESRS